MTIQSIANWFTEAVPNPTEKNKSVQTGCHFEEVSEMMLALGQLVFAQMLTDVGNLYKKTAVSVVVEDRQELLDSLCDQIVTAIGVAHMHGMDIQGALAEVNRSNYSKFEDGKAIFDAHGKIVKSRSYSPPNLEAFV
jgi:predicted HAD superfamily Cof-like phosphohydrolase